MLVARPRFTAQIDDGAAELMFGKAQTLQPPGWPVIRPGLVMTCVHRLWLVLYDGAGSEALDQYIDEVGRMIDHCSERIASLTILRGGSFWNDLSLSERTHYIKRYSAVTRARAAKMRQVLSGSVILTDSALGRAAIRTAFVLQPPGFPVMSANAIDRSWLFLFRSLPTLEAHADEAHTILRYLIRRHAPGLAGF